MGRAPFILGLLFGLSACTGEEPQAMDGGPGASDAAITDGASASDAGFGDAVAPADAGEQTDAGRVDAGLALDAESSDATSPSDVGSPSDAGQVSDAGPPPSATCAAAGGTSTVQAPVLESTLFDRWHEAWLGSPAVADLDQDGTPEILVPRHQLLLGWHADGTEVWRAQSSGSRIWASPVVADLLPGVPGLEVAFAAGDSIYAYDATASALPGFPVAWRSELRSLAAGDIDGDGSLELVAVTTTRLEQNGQRDIIMAFNADGSAVSGFPPNTSGAAGCDDACFVTGGYDQNIALGDVDGDGEADILAPHDNAYASLHHGTGLAFDSNPIFQVPTKFSGIRFLHDYALAQQGWAPDEETALQAHFTNTAPAIADIDDDGDAEIVMLASVQNASQTDRFKGVALWVLENDGTRPTGWVDPFHVPTYLSGLWDFSGTNVVGATNQVSIADIDSSAPGLEMVFAGFDGSIHAVSADRSELWSYQYTSDDRVLTAGVAIVDLSRDGSPEIVFNSYSPDDDKSKLFILSASGQELHTVNLPLRGAMPVPTVADADADGELEIVVSLKDGEDRVRQVLVFGVPGSADNCMPWPTGRGNLLRDGTVP